MERVGGARGFAVILHPAAWMEGDEPRHPRPAAPLPELGGAPQLALLASSGPSESWPQGLGPGRAIGPNTGEVNKIWQSV